MKQSLRTRSTKTNSTQGTYLYSKSRMCYIFLGSEVTADLEDTGVPKEYLLGFFSSLFSCIRPAMISLAYHGQVVIYFIEEAKLDPEIKGDYFIGTPFVVTTTTAASLQSYFPIGKEAVNHVLIH